MWGTALIVFREVLEAALVVSIIMTVTRGVNKRGLWVSGGIVAGIVFASLFAGMADVIAESFEGLGQDILNASILFIAVFMLGWHNVWMQKHGKELAQRMNQIGQAVLSGDKPMHILAAVVSLAIMREGIEVVLFTYGMVASGTGMISILSGALIGMAAGVLLGAGLYAGLLRIPTRYLFRVMALMILMLASGLASQGAFYLVQADVLPAFGYAIWDSSSLLSQQGLIGSVLHVLVGYVDQPMGIQLVFYVVTLLTISLLMRLVNNGFSRKTVAAHVVSMIVVIAGVVLGQTPAHASHKIYSPTVEMGETELEWRGHVSEVGETDSDEKHIFEIGYGIGERWFTAVLAEAEKEGSGEREVEGVAWENILQLTEQGQYWVDAGLYFEYELGLEEHYQDKLEFKLLLEKVTGGLLHTANLIYEYKPEKEGLEAESEMGFGWRTLWRMGKHFEPGFEIWGNLGEMGESTPLKQQSHVAGPVVTGHWMTSQGNKLGYELGYFVGMTEAAPESTIKWVFEYEIY